MLLTCSVMVILPAYISRGPRMTAPLMVSQMYSTISSGLRVHLIGFVIDGNIKEMQDTVDVKQWAFDMEIRSVLCCPQVTRSYFFLVLFSLFFSCLVWSSLLFLSLLTANKSPFSVIYWLLTHLLSDINFEKWQATNQTFYLGYQRKSHRMCADLINMYINIWWPQSISLKN